MSVSELTGMYSIVSLLNMFLSDLFLELADSFDNKQLTLEKITLNLKNYFKVVWLIRQFLHLKLKIGAHIFEK